MVKIRSVATEIFLIWLNVAWTYVPLWHLLKMVPETSILSLVKIGSVAAKIILIWTKVARTNVAWTNVIMTVGICSIWSQESSSKVWSKLG